MTIMERHGLGGLHATNQKFENGGEAVTITDAPGYVCLNVSDKPLRLTSQQARYLAKCFSDAADRIDAVAAAATSSN